MIKYDAASSGDWPYNSPRHASMNSKKAADEDFVVKANVVRTYSRVSAVCDLRDFRREKQACDVANGLFGPRVYARGGFGVNSPP